MNELNFIETKEYQKFVEFCRACMKYKYIGICYGNPGVGKTMSAKHYANWDKLETILTRKNQNLNQELVINKLNGIKSNTLFVTAPATRPSSLNAQLRRLAIDTAHINEIISSAQSKKKSEIDRIDYITPSLDRIVENIFYAVDLIIIDEVDRLKLQTLELLRDIYDRHNVGMVFIGMQGIEKRLSKYPQLYSRIGFAHEFKKLSSSEMNHILEYRCQDIGLAIDYKNFEDYDAINRIIKITNGNFRLIQRLFAQIDRIMEINDIEKISSDVVQAARESLIIGFTE